MIRSNDEKDWEAIMALFLNDLNIEIANMVELQYYGELEDILHIAMKMKR